MPLATCANGTKQPSDDDHTHEQRRESGSYLSQAGARTTRLTRVPEYMPSAIKYGSAAAITPKSTPYSNPPRPAMTIISFMSPIIHFPFPLRHRENIFSKRGEKHQLPLLE